MPSADCLAALADIAADPLWAVAFFCVPLSGLVGRLRRLVHAEALVSRCASLPAFFPQSRRLSRGTPGCFRYVTVESTGWAVAPPGAGNRGCHVCCLLTPQPSTPVLTGGASVLPPALFVRPISLRPASFNPPLQDESLPSAIPSRYLSRSWTCHAFSPKIGSMLDAWFDFGTLAERTSSNRARPAHNHTSEGIRQPADGSSKPSM